MHDIFSYLVREVLFIDTHCSCLQQPFSGTRLLLAVLLPTLHGLQLLLRRHPVSLHCEPEEQLGLGPRCLHEVWVNRQTAFSLLNHMMQWRTHRWLLTIKTLATNIYTAIRASKFYTQYFWQPLVSDGLVSKDQVMISNFYLFTVLSFALI